MILSLPNRWLLIALLFAPWAIIPAWLTAGVWTYFFAPVRPVDWTDLFPLFIPGFDILIAYFFTIAIGLPIFLLLRRYGLHSLFAIICVGLACVLAMLLAFNDGDLKLTFEIAFWFYCATWVAATAWVLAVWVPKMRSNRRIDTDRFAADHAGR